MFYTADDIHFQGNGMKVGDICKYMATSTVGKVTDLKEMDGRTWARLDFTDLYYDVSFLVPADVSEYKEVRFKEREKRSDLRTVKDLEQAAEDVDISDLAATGGG